MMFIGAEKSQKRYSCPVGGTSTSSTIIVASDRKPGAPADTSLPPNHDTYARDLTKSSFFLISNIKATLSAVGVGITEVS